MTPVAREQAGASTDDPGRSEMNRRGARQDLSTHASGQSLERATTYLQIGAWCGLLAGVVASAAFACKWYVGTLTFAPVTTVWREPLASVFWMTCVAAVFALGRRWWPTMFAWRNLLLVGLSLAAFAVLLLFDRLHWVASAVLAAGIGFRATQWMASHPAGLTRVMRATLVPGLAAIALAAAATTGLPYWRDRRALRPFAAANGDAPNVLLVILDTVRSWSLSAYGYARPTTPELSALAARGVLFSRAMSPSSWTLPSHASMFTGYWPHELTTDWYTPLDDRYPTLAELLGDRGYLTAGFCANARYCSVETGLARGFSHYEDYLLRGRDLLAGGPLFRLATRISWVLGAPPPEEDAESKRRNASMIVDGFLSWLDGARGAGTGQPFFAFLNLFDAHRPYTSPEDLRAPFSTPGVPFNPNLLPRSGPRRAWDPIAMQGSRDAYDASIAYVDRELGRLVDELDRRGLLANTIVVVTSDHGEQFAEHGMIGHANSLYRPSLMIPLVVVAPGLIPPRRIEAAVSTRDLARTLLDLVGHDTASMPGHSLTRFWKDPGSASAPALPVLATLRYGPTMPDWYPVSNGPVRSVVDGRWRYIIQHDGTEELYDFESDSLEQVNLVATDSGRVVASRLHVLLDSLSRDGRGSR